MTKNKQGRCGKCNKNVRLKYVRDKDKICNYYKCSVCGNEGEDYDLEIFDYDFERDD